MSLQSDEPMTWRDDTSCADDSSERSATSEPTVELRSLRRGVERRRRERTAVPCLTILYHPDLARVGERAELPAVIRGATARLSRREPAFAHPDGGVTAPLADPYLSRTPLLLSGFPGGIRLVAWGSPVEAGGVAVDPELELSTEELDRGVVLFFAGRVVLLLHWVGREPSSPSAASGPGCRGFRMIGESEAMIAACSEIRRVAELDVPVLVRGPTGSGKELAARAIHDASPRRDGPWVSVNLAAVPSSLAASELFGAVKGAFTGSVRPQAGFFQRADGGTLFLDEVGDAPVEVQAALLRVLETGEIQRVGSQAPLEVDVRLVAATDRDLEEAVGEGSFKAPLLHRLAGYEVTLPPLAERREDFGRLLVHFLRQELGSMGAAGRLAPRSPSEEPWLPPSIVARLARHDWPGNVRQLQNVARQLAVAGRDSDHVRVTPRIEQLLREAEAGPASLDDEDDTVDQTTRQHALRRGGDTPTPRRAAAAGRSPGGGTRAKGGTRAQGGAGAQGGGAAAAYRAPSDVDEDELEATLRAHHWEIKPTAAALGVSRPSLYNLIARSDRVRKVADLTAAEIRAAHAAHGGHLDAMHRALEVSRNGLRQRLLEMEMEFRE